MRRSIYRKGALDFLRGAVAPVLFTVAVMGVIIYGLHQTEESSKSEGLRILEDSIHRSVVTGYAIKGRYPESIEYIEKNYGIHVDRSKYVVHYSIFASNLYPDITVIELPRVR